jgi:hypothetical protein
MLRRVRRSQPIALPGGISIRGDPQLQLACRWSLRIGI